MTGGGTGVYWEFVGVEDLGQLGAVGGQQDQISFEGAMADQIHLITLTVQLLEKGWIGIVVDTY